MATTDTTPAWATVWTRAALDKWVPWQGHYGIKNLAEAQRDLRERAADYRLEY